MRAFLKLRYMVEAGLIGLFFVQALRYLVASLYGRVGSAAIYPAIDPSLYHADSIGLIAPEVVSGELSLLVYMLALPLVAVLLGRIRGVIVLAGVAVAVFRALMALDDSIITPTMAATVVVGAGLLYIALLIRWRLRIVPYFFIYAFALDQVYRAVGNTFDPSLSTTYFNIQLALSGGVLVLSLINFFRLDDAERTQERGLMPFFSGLGLGALLFLELALLATPNALAGRADTDYTLFVPLTLIATMLPLVPTVREWARSFVTLFDSGARGWAWMLVVALLVVFGTRFTGIAAGVMLVLAQFCISMMWWWVARPQAEKERNFGGVWLVLSTLLFALFVGFDLFTYEYAYVRDFAAPFRFLNDVVPPLLRGFRGLGLGVILLAVFLAALPMIQGRTRVPWKGGAPALQSLAAVVLIAALSGGAAYAARPVVIQLPDESDSIRIATYNIHAGFNEFFNYDLEAIAQTIHRSGADVVLLQEVEAGRLTSYGVDQSLWLARRLGMDRRFYATNEGLQGLAVLSKLPIRYDDGRLLTSIGNQTGLQRVQVQPDEGVVTLYNTWLGLLVAGGGDESIVQQELDQQQQLNEILGFIALDHTGGALGRTVIGGTFNNIPDSDLIRQMMTLGFADPFAGQPAVQSDTFWQTTRQARLDYLWLRNLSGLAALVVDSNASDHRLAVVEVAISR